MKSLYGPWPVSSGEGVRVAPESSESASARDEPPLENVLMGWVRGEREGSQTRVDSGLKVVGKSARCAWLRCPLVACAHARGTCGNLPARISE